MAKARACSSCAYWVQYPGWEGVGTCDFELSEKYGRMAVGTTDGCDYHVRSDATPPAGQGPLRSSVGGTTCESCHHWFPFEFMPRVGLCDNPESKHFRSPEFADKQTEECFVEKSLDGLEFMWCQTHRQTIHSRELTDHRRCLVFVSSASLPVEDEMELTLAGD